MPLHLGPLGGLQPINPLTDIDTTSTRVGGIHTSLSGRRTVDYLGNRATYKMQWPHLTPDELAFLEALHHRHVPGPLRLVPGGLKRNRLSRDAASLRYNGASSSAVTATAGTGGASAPWPTEAPPPGQSLSWTGWAAGNALRWDRDHPPPVLAGETVTATAYVRTPTAGDAVRLVLDYYSADGWGGSQQGPVVTLDADTWTRLTVTTTPPAGTWAVGPAIVTDTRASTSAELLVAAAQVEAGDIASPWQQGGGAPLVAVDQMPTTSLYAPYTKPELTLVEL